jgi:hypothetical protein
MVSILRELKNRFNAAWNMAGLYRKVYLLIYGITTKVGLEELASQHILWGELITREIQNLTCVTFISTV